MSIYVMSDIHGHFDRFYKMLNKINIKKEDHVYILGDVIDRGPNGIEILQYIIKDKRFTLLLGNHEKMMLDFYNERYKENPDFYYEEIWYRNGCYSTRNEFEMLSIKKQKEILEYLLQCPLAICDLMVKDRKYYLVHACPSLDYQQDVIYLHTNKLTNADLHRFIWERINLNEKHFDDRCVIVGHTMTLFYQKNLPYSVYSDHTDLFKAKLIDIDCGCAKNDIYSRLATIRLDDMKVFYV